MHTGTASLGGATLPHRPPLRRSARATELIESMNDFCGMVLEQELLFFEKAEAEEFFAFIRSTGCSGRIRTLQDLVADPMFCGSIGNFLTLLEEEAARIESDPEGSEELAGVYAGLKESLERRRDNLAAYLEEHAVGEIVPQRSVLADIATLLEEAKSRGEGKEQTDAGVAEALAAIDINALLEENDLVEKTEEGRRLVRTIDPDEARTCLPEYPLCETDPDILSERGIDVRLSVFAEQRYIVSMGPEIVLIDDREQLWEILEDMDVPDDSYTLFRNNMTLGQFVIERIMALLEERGRASKEEILEEATSFETSLDGERSTATFFLTEDYIGGILADLKKLGLIAGKDAKLKPVRVR